MDRETKEELKNLLTEVLNRQYAENDHERKEYRKKVDDLCLAIKGNPDVGVKGLVENVECLVSFKPELNLIRWIKSSFLYILIAGLVTFLGIHLKLYFLE